MKSTSGLNRLFGIRVRIHYSWIFALILIVAIIITQYPETYSIMERVFYGIITGLLFFSTIYLREFLINLVAHFKGHPTPSITLFVFGGVTPITKKAETPMMELLLASTGLLANLLLAGLFYTIHSILVATGNVTADLFIQWLVFISSMLALLHFLPAYPLDGGKILRVLLRQRDDSFYAATRITAWIGQVTGLLFVLGGILLVVMRNQWLTGTLLAFAGWVLQGSAARGRRQAVFLETLQNYKAEDIATRKFELVPAETRIAPLVRDHIESKGIYYFFVTGTDGIKGLVTIENIKAVPRRKWGRTSVGKIATPLSRAGFITRQQSAVNALEEMDRLERDYLPVMENNNAFGLITRNNLTELVRAKAELGLS